MKNPICFLGKLIGVDISLYDEFEEDRKRRSAIFVVLIVWSLILFFTGVILLGIIKLLKII